jgi:hypothetical protein
MSVSICCYTIFTDYYRIQSVLLGIKKPFGEVTLTSLMHKIHARFNKLVFVKLH